MDVERDAATSGLALTNQVMFYEQEPSLARVAASAFLDGNGDSEFIDIERQSHGSHLPSEVVDQAAVPNRHQSERHPNRGGNIISYV